MTKERAIDIELSEIVREFEGLSNEKIAENFELKTFKNGKIKFHYKNLKHIYFYAQRISHSYDKYGYDLVIDFHQKLLPNKCVKVLKDIEDYEIYGFKNQSSKKLYETDLYSFLDNIIDLNHNINLNNLNASDALRIEKSIISA